MENTLDLGFRCILAAWLRPRERVCVCVCLCVRVCMCVCERLISGDATLVLLAMGHTEWILQIKRPCRSGRDPMDGGLGSDTAG